MNKLDNIHRRRDVVKLVLEEPTTGTASKESPESHDFPK